MLDVLFGSKSIAKILIFLFVNGKGYGAQLQRMLQTPLTPLQKALSRLENGGVIMSYCEGKTRIYQLHPAFPLLPELEQLVKKMYTLLPPHEKKRYYVNEVSTRHSRSSSTHVLMAFWERLIQVKRLFLDAKSKAEGQGWNHKGKGDVVVSKERSHVLLFHEKGNWQGKQGEVTFSNVYRWTLDHQAGVISLEHLRRGAENPVFLFHLAPSGNQTLSSVDSHLCEGDIYLGQIFFDQHHLRLHWRVIGPKKNEEIEYTYS